MTTRKIKMLIIGPHNKQIRKDLPQTEENKIVLRS